MSRNPHEPSDKTRNEVSALCSFGIPHDEIAAYIGIDAKTLRKYYREELDISMVKASAAVGTFLYQNATGRTLKEGASHSDCIRAAMFWAKTRMKWKETTEVDHKSSDGSMTPKPAIDASKLSDTTIEEILSARGDGGESVG